MDNLSVITIVFLICIPNLVKPYANTNRKHQLIDGGDRTTFKPMQHYISTPNARIFPSNASNMENNVHLMNTGAYVNNSDNNKFSPMFENAGIDGPLIEALISLLIHYYKGRLECWYAPIIKIVAYI